MASDMGKRQRRKDGKMGGKMSPTPFFCKTADKRDTYEILEGNFKLERYPSSREIRLYISSEFAGSTNNYKLFH